MTKTPQPFSENNEAPPGRYQFLFWGMVFFFLILGTRLWYLQIIKGEELRNKSESNRTEVVDLPPVRGLVLDRDGTVLVDNRASFDLCVQKSEISDSEALLEELAAITGRSYEDLHKKYTELPRTRYVSLPLINGLSREELVAIESRRFRLDGVSIRVNSARLALSDVFASHIIGYLGEIGARQLENEKKRLDETVEKLISDGLTVEEARLEADREINPHRSGDLVGQSGIEQSMEKLLQGHRGYNVREVDSRGRVLREIQTVNPEPGYNLRLTLDSRLQALGQSLLGERAGSIVVMDPRNFEILTLASSPTFSLNDFVGGISGSRWKALQEDPFHPMENRAVAGQYPPGSTFKIVTALAALAEGVITPETTFHCGGGLRLGNHTFGCHNRRGHGAVNLKRSLMYSCDVYYYEVGRRLGVDRLAKRAREFFGLGRRMGIDLLTEQPGLIPDTAWKLRRFEQKWAPGETLPVSIGQGYVLCSPLQVAQFTAVLANGGTLYRPHLVKEVVDVGGNVVKTFEPEFISKIDIKPEYITAVQKGLEAVVNEPGGTGRRGKLPDVLVSGKTGTSQVVSLKRFQGYAKSKLPYKYRDHAWFTSYAPSENPEVVVTVLLEHTGGGGVNAAPIAREMLAAYFDKRIVAAKLPPAQVQPDKPTGWSAQ
ncbi:penicillin-binding protein 2 [Deltaproteobacteria bacterium Smac51]|nr:penicillin-binding protein 2 [Deltaproteobacteria bacterium Smac51]